MGGTKVTPGQTCHYCPDVATTRDHRVPHSRCITPERFTELGRGDHDAYHLARRMNVTAACLDCNSRKGQARARCGCLDCRESWRLLIEPDATWLWWTPPGHSGWERPAPLSQSLAEVMPAWMR